MADKETTYNRRIIVDTVCASKDNHHVSKKANEILM